MPVRLIHDRRGSMRSPVVEGCASCGLSLLRADEVTTVLQVGANELPRPAILAKEPFVALEHARPTRTGVRALGEIAAHARTTHARTTHARNTHARTTHARKTRALLAHPAPDCAQEGTHG